MRIQLKKLADQVVVITGASSGIGLATARLAAKRGARLVLASRNEHALRQLTEELNRQEVQAAFVVADVGKEVDVARIARTALERFGTFDTWINDAGIGIYGGLLGVSTADSKRLFDTNFWGVVYGSLEAARHLRSKTGEFGGAIINLGSEVSDRSVPVIGMYSASKHAVKGFTDSLRMELEYAGNRISVSLVKPTAIDTPFPLHAKNYMDKDPQLPSPVYAPEVVAEVILHCAEHPERDMFAGGPAKAHSVEEKLMPRSMDKIMEGSFFEKQKSDRPASHVHESLHEPKFGLHERSGTRNDAKEWSLYSKSSMHPLVTGLAVAGAGLGLMAILGTAVGVQKKLSQGSW
jgi:short-subunit dehydrogenase